MSDKFKQLIDEAERILITSHVSPDPDAVASVLLLGTTLELNFPDKKVEMVLEEEPDGLSFLEGYEQIKFEPLVAATESFKPDLIILVDVANFGRASRKGGLELKEYVKKSHAKLVIIDHHEPEGRDESDLYFNSIKSATVHEIYNIVYSKLHLKKPGNSAQIAMTGLYGDTGGFTYIDASNVDAFELAAELVREGASVETLKYQLNQFSEDQIQVVCELSKNLSHFKDFTYSFLGDEFVSNWQKSGKQQAALQRANKIFIDNYIRNIDGRNKGFIIYRNPLEGDDMYSISFRAARDSQDVSKLALMLNGGGHKSSAGGKVQAKSVEEAIDKVKEIISLGS